MITGFRKRLVFGKGKPELPDRCKCCGRRAVKDGYCHRCAGQLSSSGDCVLCTLRRQGIPA